MGPDRYLTRIEDYGRVSSRCRFPSPMSVGGRAGRSALPGLSPTEPAEGGNQPVRTVAQRAKAAADPVTKDADSSPASPSTILVVGKANDLAGRYASRSPTIPAEPTTRCSSMAAPAQQDPPDPRHRQRHPGDPEKWCATSMPRTTTRRGPGLSAKSFDSFKRYYRSLDVLLLDDVQFFNGKNRSQEEFFFLFNALVEARSRSSSPAIPTPRTSTVSTTAW